MASVAPTAFASDRSSTGTVASVRSFPAQKHVSSRSAFVEVTSVSVSDDSNWGGLDGLSVTKTQSPAEVAAAQKAAADAAAQRAAAEQTRVSRSEQRKPISSSNTAATTSSTTPAPAATVSGNGAAAANYAMQFLGAPYVYGGSTPRGWDCSGFVMYVFAHFGISLPHSSGADMGAGTAVPSLSQAQPGDILANGSHVAIYIGNGMVVNALNPAEGTVVTPVSYAMHGSYAIRRLL